MRWITHIEGGPKRVNHAAVAVGHKIYTFGGYCTGESSREYTSIDVHVLNTTTFRWTKHPVSNFPYLENDDILPYKRYGHTAVVYKDKIYIWGGRNDQASCAVLFCFDTFYHCWTAPQTTGDIPLARDGHTACVWKHYMYIFGGFEEETDSFAKSVHVLDLETMHWRYIHTVEKDEELDEVKITFVHRCGPATLFSYPTHADVLWVSVVDVLTKVNLFTPTGRTYTLVESDETDFNSKLNFSSGIEPAVRDFHSAACLNDRMYIFGGRGTESRHSLYLPGREIYCDELWYLDLHNHTWHNPYTSGIRPIGRRSHSAFVYNGKMYIFGGYNALKLEHYNDLFEYDPVISEWTLLRPHGESPCNRRRQACIVVDDRVFLFGGTSPVTGIQQQQQSNVEEELTDHSDMHILDFQPSLKTLCVLAVYYYKLDFSSLPQSLMTEVENMFTPNKITISRPSNSAG